MADKEVDTIFNNSDMWVKVPEKDGRYIFVAWIINPVYN
jgi:hypothetical protein